MIAEIVSGEIMGGNDDWPGIVSIENIDEREIFEFVNDDEIGKNGAFVLDPDKWYGADIKLEDAEVEIEDGIVVPVWQLAEKDEILFKCAGNWG